MSAKHSALERFAHVFGNEDVENKCFINFGAGNWTHPCFKNMDIVHPRYPDNKPDIVYDAFARQPFPIESATIGGFYFSHVNEHLPDQINDFLFAEVFRCLRPGGVVRFVFPDFDKALRAYARSDRDFFQFDWWRRSGFSDRMEWSNAALLLEFVAGRALRGGPEDGNKKYSADEFAEWISEESPYDVAKQICRALSWKAQKKNPNTHCNWWTVRKFKKCLEKVGFSNVWESSYLGSVLYPLRDSKLFDTTFPHMSGYVEAQK